MSHEIWFGREDRCRQALFVVKHCAVQIGVPCVASLVDGFRVVPTNDEHLLAGVQSLHSIQLDPANCR